MATILVVDDNEAHLYALVRLLQARGYQVMTATSGAQALQEASKRPDIIVLDINMPDIDGFAVAAKLRADPLTRDVPFLFLTATSSGGDSQQIATHLGASAFLTYPVEIDTLQAVISGCIARAKDKNQSK
jgi:CheY-like chemotaxis protein